MAIGINDLWKSSPDEGPQQSSPNRSPTDGETSSLHRSPRLPGPFLSENLLWESAFRDGWFVLQSHLDHLRKVQGVTVSTLGDLFATTEAVGDDQRIGWLFVDSWKKFQFAYRHRNVIFPSFEAERAGHAATARSWRMEIDTHSLEYGCLRPSFS